MSILVFGLGFIFLIAIIVIIISVASSKDSNDKIEEPMITVRTKDKK